MFAIENVIVDVTADNALQAREKAFEEAQVKAFAELAARMLPESARAGFTPPAASEISPLILDYEVTNEKLSSKRYIGTYTFRFSEQGVSRYFDVRGVSGYRVEEARPLLILPFLEHEGRTLLWSPYNLWLTAWTNSSDLRAGALPLIVPIGDLTDVSDIGDDDAPDYNERGLASMLRRYGAGEAVIAIARPADPKAALNVEIYRTDRGQAEYVGSIEAGPVPSGDPSALYNAALGSVIRALGQDWKNGAGMMTPSPSVSESFPPPAVVGSRVSVRAVFTGLQEWAAIQRALARASGISDIMLRTISPHEAFLELAYSGDIGHLKLALEQAGFELAGPHMRPDGTPFYDLILRGAVHEPRSQASSSAGNTHYQRPDSSSGNGYYGRF